MQQILMQLTSSSPPCETVRLRIALRLEQRFLLTRMACFCCRSTIQASMSYEHFSGTPNKAHPSQLLFGKSGTDFSPAPMAAGPWLSAIKQPDRAMDNDTKRRILQNVVRTCCFWCLYSPVTMEQLQIRFHCVTFSFQVFV